MGAHVFDHGAERKQPLSRRLAALILLAFVLAVGVLWATLGEGVQAAWSSSSGAKTANDAQSLRGFVEAAGSGDVERVDSLLERRVDPNARDDEGQSALSAAIRAGETGIVRRLLAAGARLSGRSRKGILELHFAAVHDDAELVDLLVDAGASVTEKADDQDGATALHVASERDLTIAADALLRAGAGIDVQDARGFTALARAALLGRSAAIDLLVERGADLSIKDARGRTALQLAAAAGDAESVQVLLAAGADPRIADDQAWTALHEAAAHGRTEVVRALARVLDRRALNARTSRGATALHLVARRGEANGARALLDAGADPRIRDAEDRLARDLAPPGVFEEPWSRLGPAKSIAALRRPESVLLDATEQRPQICLCTRPASTLRGPAVLLDLAIWDDGAIVFAPWSADGSREYVAGVLSPTAVKGVLLDLQEIGWLDAAPPPIDPERRDCVELAIEHRGSRLRRRWDEVEHFEPEAAGFTPVALADWALGRSRACDILRTARPAATQSMSFVLVRGRFRGLSFEDGAHASWME